MKKISSPFKQVTRKDTKSVKTVQSPFQRKQVLRVSRYAEIYKESDKIYFKAHAAKYPRVLATIEEFGGEKVLTIKERNLEERPRFNAWLMENTSMKNVLYHFGKDLFFIPVERILASGRGNFNRTGEKTIDQTLYLPFDIIRIYAIQK